MNVRLDTVLDADSRVAFKGTTEDTISWLEQTSMQVPLWVCIGATGDLITASQYLDLAS